MKSCGEQPPKTEFTLDSFEETLEILEYLRENLLQEASF